jgi:hypothetical protein
MSSDTAVGKGASGMIRKAGLLAVGFAVMVALAPAEEKKEDSGATKNARFEQFKQLAGEWIGENQKDEKGPKQIHVKYRVTAGGSAVVETIFPGTENEMITVIHPDGENLILTHYCMLGNQPQMKASAKGDPKVVPFEFVRVTNLKSEKAMFMHDVTYYFLDKDTIKTEWTHFNDGKEAGKGIFEVKRKK